MDIAASLCKDGSGSITCIDMHTTGEPTRIVIAGYGRLTGTLLEQRAQAKAEHDNVRKRLMLEPRGHFDMYGAILAPDTELTATGAAHMGVLFMTNDGYSTMCGHATIALGRFLLDTHDTTVFPGRNEIVCDMEAQTAELRLHAPCGLVTVTVPVTKDGQKSDPSRPVSFISTPSFATGINVVIPIPPQHRWPQLGSRTSITADFGYGGAFYCIVSATTLGFEDGLSNVDFSAMNNATRLLKLIVNENTSLRATFTHPDHQDLGFLYSVLVVDDSTERPLQLDRSEELGLCYFANQQVDRSPTGSAVAARVALAYAKDSFQFGQTRTYHSLLSRASSGIDGFDGTLYRDVRKEVSATPYPAVLVKVSGQAYYTGSHVFAVEAKDPLGDSGFVFEQLNPR